MQQHAECSSSSSDRDLALQVRGLAKFYGASAGIFDVNLNVKKGRIHAFLGPNGAGKTTTIKCVMGLLHKSSGEIRIFDNRLDDNEETIKIKKQVGYSPELPCYPTYLRGREVLECYGRIRGISENSLLSDSTRLLSLVGLSDTSERTVGKYSRGMLARLGLAAALLGDPELLLLDEPTAGLDPVGVVEVRELLKQLVEEGHTILLSSHQLSEVQEVCETATVVNHGRTVAEGPILELVRISAGGAVFTAEFNSLSEQLLGSLRQIDGLSEISTIGHNTVRVVISKECDVRPILARIAVDHGALLLTCDRKTSSLEDLFMKLVKAS